MKQTNDRQAMIRAMRKSQGAVLQHVDEQRHTPSLISAALRSLVHAFKAFGEAVVVWARRANMHLVEVKWPGISEKGDSGEPLQTLRHG